MIGQFDTTIWRNMVVTARRRPSVMTALLSPDRTIVVFSSSMKRLEGNVKPQDFVNAKNQVLKALLDETSAYMGQEGHRTQSSCGEIMALHVALRAGTQFIATAMVSTQGDGAVQRF
jgi:hypothetical protein